MTPSHDLYDLIHSLTSTEKRYVRRSALVSGRETSWLRLFDIIEGQQKFDEVELRAALAGDPMLGNLSVAKRYTYDAVLRALQSYGTGRDFDSQIGEMIEQYKVLVHKGLHAQAARMMREIKQRALAGDAYLRLFWTIIRDFGAAAYSTEQAAMDHLEKSVAEQFGVLHCIENYTMVGTAYFRQRIVLRHRPNARSRQEQERLEEIMAPLMALEEEQLLSPTARSFYHLAFGDYWEAIGRPELARPHFDRFLNAPRLDIEIGATDLLPLAEFTNALFFRLRHRMTEGLDESFEALRKKIGKIGGRRHPFTTQILYYERWLVASLMLLNLTHRTNEAVDLLTTEGERIDALSSAMTKKLRLQLLLNVAGIRLAQGDHSRAIDALNSVLNDNETSTEEYGTAMLLAIVAHVESNNTDWLDAALRSTTRHLTARDRYHRTEQAMIEGLHHILQAKDEAKRRKAYAQLHNHLQELFSDPRERTVSVAIDLLAWTKAHATGVAFATIIAQRTADGHV